MNWHGHDIDIIAQSIKTERERCSDALDRAECSLKRRRHREEHVGMTAG